ncbi:PAS domain-containing protein, partial [Burkholderia sp. SIMBA_024]
PLTYLGFSRFIAPEYQMLFFSALREGQRTGEKQGLELQILRRDQSRIWVHLDLQMRVDDEGDPRQWQLTLTDVTAEKEGQRAR